jgi:hypothetical protein
MYWDESLMEFSDNFCSVVPGYTSDEISCSCSRTGTEAPTFSPTMLPTPVPTHVPIPAPTMLPIPSPTTQSNSPTSLPIPSPTVYTSPSPSFSPTSSPTTSDTISIAMEMTMTASGAPTTTDEDALKDIITNYTNAKVSNFAISSQVIVRRYHRRDLLTSYQWTVTCNLVVDLSSSGASSATDLATTYSTVMLSSSFYNSVSNKLTTTVSSIDGATGSVNSRSPTMMPVPSPTTPAPTASDTMGGGGGGGDGGGGGSGSLVLIIILVSVVAALIVGALVYRYVRSTNSRSIKVGIIADTDTKSNIDKRREPAKAVAITTKDAAVKGLKKKVFLFLRFLVVAFLRCTKYSCIINVKNMKYFHSTIHIIVSYQ